MRDRMSGNKGTQTTNKTKLYKQQTNNNTRGPETFITNNNNNHLLSGLDTIVVISIIPGGQFHWQGRDNSSSNLSFCTTSICPFWLLK